MKMLSETQIKLLTCLADGVCHSGNELGVQLNISRTAIWKHIKQLLELNIPITCIPHKGYCLTTPMTLLNKDTIREQLNSHHFNEPIEFHFFYSIDSTNRFLKELSPSGAIDICCAEIQTHGRGRFGRHWHSPFGENIYCSSRWHFNCDLSRLSGLSLIVSLAIMATLNDFGIHEQVQVKWPNDILWYNKKLCGNLIEVLAESNSGAEVIIGIGLNVNSHTKGNPLSDDRPWCSLYEITDEYLDRNLVIARLIINLNAFLTKFLMHGFASFISLWQDVDYLYDQMVTVTNHQGVLNGRANGVNEAGQLVLIDEAGVIHYLSSGDTSLHGGGCW